MRKCGLEKNYPHKDDLKEGYLSDKIESMIIVSLSH